VRRLLGVTVGGCDSWWVGVCTKLVVHLLLPVVGVSLSVDLGNWNVVCLKGSTSNRGDCLLDHIGQEDIVHGLVLGGDSIHSESAAGFMLDRHGCLCWFVGRSSKS